MPSIRRRRAVPGHGSSYTVRWTNGNDTDELGSTTDDDRVLVDDFSGLDSDSETGSVICIVTEQAEHTPSTDSGVGPVFSELEDIQDSDAANDFEYTADWEDSDCLEDADDLDNAPEEDGVIYIESDADSFSEYERISVDFDCPTFNRNISGSTEDLTPFDDLLTAKNLNYIGAPKNLKCIRRVLMLNWDARRIGRLGMAPNLVNQDLTSTMSRPVSEVEYTLRSIVRALIFKHEMKLCSLPSMLATGPTYLGPGCIAIPLLYRDSAEVPAEIRAQSGRDPYGSKYGRTDDMLLLFQEDVIELASRFGMEGTRDPRIVAEDEGDLDGAYPDDDVVRGWYVLGNELLEQIDWIGSELDFGLKVDGKPRALVDKERRILAGG